jgi:hypothetical protein
MKYLIWLVILALAGFLIYQYLIRPPSAEEAEIRQLEKVFRSAGDQYVASVRQAGTPGMAEIADPESAINKIKRVRERLAVLKKDLTDKTAIVRARRLEQQINDFCTKNEID